MPLRKTPMSLYVTCMKKIAKNHKYKRNRSLFSSLPNCLINDFFRRKKEFEIPKSHRWSSKLFINSNTSYIDSLNKFNKRPNDLLLTASLICTHLTHINFYTENNSKKLREIQFDLVFQRLPNIQHLDFGHYQVTDEIFAQIGKRCGRLKYLHVNDCWSITGKGIRSLCMTRDDMKIEYLGLFTFPVESFPALKGLRYLKTLKCEVYDQILALIMEEYETSDNFRTYSLGKLKYKPWNQNFSSVFPHLRELHISGPSENDFQQLSNGIALRDVFSGLMELHLAKVVNVDFECIATSCPSLERLFFTSCTIFNPAVDNLQNSMTKFKRLTFFCVHSVGFDPWVMILVLKSMMYLKKLYIHNCNLDERCIDELKMSKALPNLVDLTLWSCRLLNLNCVKKILEMECPLRKLDMNFNRLIEKKDISKLMEFIKIQNYDLKILTQHNWHERYL